MKSKVALITVVTDVSKLNGLGWKHKVSLEKGVEKMYAWYLSE